MNSEAKRVGPAATGRHASGSSGHNNRKAPGLQQLWQEYLRMLQEKPVLTKAVTSGAIAALGNLTAQKLVERSKLDLSRLAKFTAIGVIFGPVSHYKFLVLDYVFKGAKGSRTSVAFMKLASDQLVCGPLMNVLFFVLLALFNGMSVKDTVRNNLWPTQLNSWKIWPLASLVTFLYIPPHLRVLFGNLIGFFWSIILTAMSRTKQK